MATSPLLDIVLRSDWAASGARDAAGAARDRVRVEASLAVFALLMLLMQQVRGATAATSFFSLLLFTAVFLGYPLWSFAQARSRAGPNRWVIPGGVLILTLLAWITTPPVARDAGWRGVPVLPVACALLLLPLSYGLLGWARAARRGLLQILGLETRGARDQMVIGAALGIALALHQALSARFLSAGGAPPALSPAHFWWLGLVILGVRALGEELALRGWLLPLLLSHGQFTPLGAGLRVVLLNLVLYLAPAAPWHGPGWSLSLAYGVAFAVVATWLRFTTGALVAPLAANLAYHLLAAALGAM